MQVRKVKRVVMRLSKVGLGDTAEKNGSETPPAPSIESDTQMSNRYVYKLPVSLPVMNMTPYVDSIETERCVPET